MTPEARGLAEQLRKLRALRDDLTRLLEHPEDFSDEERGHLRAELERLTDDAALLATRIRMHLERS